jgi:predicted small lipoprotein YifL
LFVFTDETWIEINAPRQLLNVTRPRGSNPYDYVIPQSEKVAVTFMLWSYIAVGHKGPLYIWEKETPAEKQRLDQILSAENAARLARQRERQHRATIPGTEEYRIL